METGKNRKTEEIMDGTEVVPDEKSSAGGSKNSESSLEDKLFTVQAIRGKRVRKGRLEYLIKWMHWSE